VIDDLGSPLERLYRGAILDPRGGALHPARWVRRLAAHAAAAGADIREHDPVDVERLDADVVVVAGDGFIPRLLPDLASAVSTTRGQVVATEPLRERRYERPHHARGGFDYWHQLPDGRLVAGGSRDAALDAEQTDVDETTPVIQGQIEALVARLVGRRPAITHRWTGVWGATRDQMPLVGRVPGRDDVWVAGGYSGHGNVLGFACGDLVARAILGETPPELGLFDPARFAAAGRLS
jgi:glycine/D-amino acid oxidase-like deaminating enzyme